MVRYICGSIILFACLHQPLSAQRKTNISGIIRSATTQETLIGASVQWLGHPAYTATTNSYGFFSLAVPASYPVRLIVSYAGFTSDTLVYSSHDKYTHNIGLRPSADELAAVVVSTQQKASTGVWGENKISPKEIEAVPVLLGEKDILKTLQLLPGIKSAGDGNSGFYVRGGGADQNLILLDDAPIYNASHLLGFFSTFNSDAVKDVSVYKGNMPAQYGGRLASALDVRTNDGDASKTNISGGIGLIASRFNIDGPIVRNRGAYSIHARRTYVDAFLKLSKDSAINRNTLNFYDLNGKANYRLDDKNTLFFSAYYGRDNLGFAKNFGLNWGNTALSLRWNHIYNNTLFSNTSLIYSNYDYKVKIDMGNNNIDISSSIKDFNLRNEWQLYINNQSKLNFGFNTIHHNIAPGAVVAGSSSNFNSQILERKHSLESAVWLSHDYRFSRQWQLVYGARLSNFTVLGPGTFYSYNSDGDAIDSVHYRSSKTVRSYWNIEPRAALNYTIKEGNSIRLSLSRNAQNLHLLSNSTAANPTDVWIPSSNNIRPEIADQVAIGYFGFWQNKMFEFSSELYYKSMQQQIDYKNGAEIIVNQDVESQLLIGKGRAYGWENYFKKTSGRLTGWISYTLSKTERKFDQINNNTWFPARQDRTHEISLVGIYKLNPKWVLSGTWIYYTGNAITYPSGKYEVSNMVVNYYTERNGYRMPTYHRLDLGATLQGKKTKKYESSWTFSLYNAYGRENAYSLTFKLDPDNNNRTVVERTALFRFIPAVTYNFKF